MRPSKRRLTRAVVYAMVLLVIIGMALAGAGTALAQPPHSAQPHRSDLSRDAPIVVLGTENLSWEDLLTLAEDRDQDPKAAQDAREILDFARANEPVNLVTRTVSARTSLSDGWATIGAGERVEWAFSSEPSPTALARALDGGLKARTLGLLASPALSTGAGQSEPYDGQPLDLRGADLLLVDTVPPDRVGDTMRLASLAQALRSAQALGARIILASVADDESPQPQVAVLPAGTTSSHGSQGDLLVGASTHRPGLIQLTDLAPTLVKALTGQASGWQGHALDLPSGEQQAQPARSADRLETLADDAHHAYASAWTTFLAGAALVIAAVALGVRAAATLRAPRVTRGPGSPGGASRPDPRSARIIGIAACAAASLPGGALLANALPWWRAGEQDDPFEWRLTIAAAGAQLLMAGLLALLALGAAQALRQMSRRPGARPALTAVAGPILAGLTALLWLADAATGAHLAFNGPLGMNAVVAGRFYGVSNTAFSLIASCLIVALALTWQALGRGRQAMVVVTCVSVVALIADGAPQLGADVGGAVTLVPALAVLVAGLARVRLGWRAWLGIGAATLLAVSALAAVDLARPPESRTHLGRFAEQVLSGEAGSTLGRKAFSLVAPFLSNVLALAALFMVLVMTGAVAWWLRREAVAWRQRRSPYAWLARADATDPAQARLPAWLRPALTSLGVLTVVAVLSNDSGITMAGFILAGALPPLTAVLAARAR